MHIRFLRLSLLLLLLSALLLQPARGEPNPSAGNALPSGALLRLPGSANEVCSIAFSTDGNMLASGCKDGTIRVCEIATGKDLIENKGNGKEPAHSVAISPDGRHLVASGDRYRIWEIPTGKKRVDFSGVVMSMAFSADGEVLATSGGTGAFVWDAHTFFYKPLAGVSGHKSSVNAVAISADKKFLASGGWDWAVRVWDTNTSKSVAELKGHTSAVWGLAFSGDGKTLSSVSSDRILFIRETGTWKQLHEITICGPALPGLFYSSDSKLLASGCPDAVQLWDVDTGKEHLRIESPAGKFTAFAFLQDGTQVATGMADSSILIWNVAALLEERK